MARRVKVEPGSPEQPMPIASDIRCIQPQLPAGFQESVSLSEHVNRIMHVFYDMTHCDDVEGSRLIRICLDTAVTNVQPALFRVVHGDRVRVCSRYYLSLIHISEPTRRTPISYA